MALLEGETSYINTLVIIYEKGDLEDWVCKNNKNSKNHITIQNS